MVLSGDWEQTARSFIILGLFISFCRFSPDRSCAAPSAADCNELHGCVSISILTQTLLTTITSPHLVNVGDHLSISLLHLLVSLANLSSAAQSRVPCHEPPSPVNLNPAQRCHEDWTCLGLQNYFFFPLKFIIS